MEFVGGIIAALVGTIGVMFYYMNKLRSDKKLSDSKIEDAKLETKQQELSDTAKELREMLKKDIPNQVNKEESAEDFWNKRDS